MASTELVLIAFSGSLGTKAFSVLLDPVFTLEDVPIGAPQTLKKIPEIEIHNRNHGI